MIIVPAQNVAGSLFEGICGDVERVEAKYTSNPPPQPGAPTTSKQPMQSLLNKIDDMLLEVAEQVEEMSERTAQEKTNEYLESCRALMVKACVTEG